MNKKSKMRVITINIPEEIDDLLKNMESLNLIPSRSEAIRQLIWFGFKHWRKEIIDFRDFQKYLDELEEVDRQRIKNLERKEITVPVEGEFLRSGIQMKTYQIIKRLE